MFPSRQIALWWLASLFVKLALAVALPLSFDESYYWVWSQHLQLSYFDHPPMVAWLFKLGHLFESFGNAVRWPGVIVGHITILVLIHTLKEIVSPRSLSFFILLSVFSPFLGFGSLILTPDIPVVLFWSLSLFFFSRILHGGRAIDAIGLGISLGLGFCSKYHIVLFLPAAVLYLFWDKKWSSFSPRNIVTIIVSGFVASLPVIIWNYQNEFSSFLFQINHGFGRPEWSPEWTITYLIGQLLVIFPIPFYFAVKASRSPTLRFWICFAWFPILFFAISSFRGVVEANWPIIAYPAIYVLAAEAWTHKKLLWTTLGIWLLSFAVLFQASLHPKPDPRWGKIEEFHRYDDAIPATQKYSPIFAENFQMASFLWYTTKKPIYKLHQMSRPDFYDQFAESKPSTDSFYVIMDPEAGWPEWLNELDFDYEDSEVLNPNLVVRHVQVLP